MFSFGRWFVFFYCFIVICHSRNINLSHKKNHVMHERDSKINEDTLILTHVVFRHGNRTVDSHAELYPKDPYLKESYEPYGKGQLTNVGKRKEFAIGTALRSRYDDFLGDQYYPDIIEALSTDYNRTKMSLQLVLAGLFPPDEDSMWKEGFYWQPVPYNYLPKQQDKIFRHGNRTPDSQAELYPNDPYLNKRYFPYGLGQLTNAGKRREFSIGTTLRNRYNEFLGEYYYPEVVEAISTDYNRTKMSLQLVLAGLFPPREEDMLQDNIYWQPVPYNYVPRAEDKLLIGLSCPRYLKIYEEYSASREAQTEFKKFKKHFDYISRNSGLNATRFLDVYQLYFGLSTESEYGLSLPSWTNAVWPNIITDLAIREYYISMANLEMRKMAVGYLLKKIVGDIRKRITDPDSLGRKIYLYSAHENNLAELLISLGVFRPHIPNYGAYVVIEVHRVENQYGIQIIYENYDGYSPEKLKMPGCDVLCPLDTFVSLVKKYFPTDSLCGN